MADEGSRQKEHLSGIYSRAAATYDRVGPPYFAHFGRQLVERARIREGVRVLDIASGRGAVLFPVAEKVGPTGEVVGIDIAGEMVRLSSAEITGRGLTNARLLRMDVEALEFPDASFDCVLCGFATFFFPDLARAVAQIKRVLKPGGTFAASTWGKQDERWSWIWELAEPYLQDGGPPRALNDESVDPGAELRRRLEGAGFAAIQQTQEALEIIFPDKENWWQTSWSHGTRGLLERLGDNVETYRREAYAKLDAIARPDGIPAVMTAVYTTATRP